MVIEDIGPDFFSKKLIDWYVINKRELPWRGIDDPYKIWLSEIILQQTRVAQGMDYYLRMIERFPDVGSLAATDEDEVLKYWQGLGYYSRARNLHAAARSIVRDYRGKMPGSYAQLLALKGIGEYTAAAIASFSQNEPCPVVDGNVFRFLSRYFGISEPIDTGKGKKLFTEIAGKLMDKKRAGIFNQAIMEFGALQCVPGAPDCTVCPFRDSCMALSENKTTFYPVKQNKTKQQNRYFHYFHVITGSHTYIHKRNQKDIWHNLYEFPMVETAQPASFEELQQHPDFRKLFDGFSTAVFQLKIADRKHVLSHRILWANFYTVTIEKVPKSFRDFIPIDEKDWGLYAVHRLMESYLEANFR